MSSALWESWKDLVKGGMECALKTEQELPKEAWAWWAMGCPEAYKYFSPNEHKAKQKW